MSCSLCAPSDPYEAPDSGKDLINVIAGVASGALVLVVLVFVITYITTKWSTKKELLKSSSQPSNVSPDSCEVR